MKTTPVPFRLLPLLFLAVACSEPSTPAVEGRPAPPPSAVPATESRIARVPPAAFGEPFPAHVYRDLNPASGTEGRLNLADLVGKRPVVFFYWIAGRSRSERMFVDLQRIVDEIGPDRIALVGIVREKAGVDARAILERVKSLGVRVPVLDDEEFRLGQQLGVRSVPSLSILDAEGRLRLANGGSLQQVLEYNLDVAGAVRRVGQKGSLGTYGSLPRYDPVNELVGKRCPDFEAPMVGDSSTQRWSALLDPKRVNVLLFWSVDCPHCKTTLPKINDWLRARPEGINLVGAATVSDDAARAKTEEYCRLSQFVFPTFVDRGLQIGELYQVTSTPTALIIRPDGVIDSVLLGEQDFAKVLEEKRRDLLARAQRS